jgi:Rod binding domain-containing protein
MNISALTSVLSSPTAPTAGDGTARAAAPATDAQRKKAAAQFEAIFVRQLLGKSVGSMLGGSEHTTGMVYGDLMTDVLAQNLTAGQGLGLSRMIEKQLTPPGASTAANTSSKTSP